ncbi:hypothetical protein G9A89_005663 [Geosiphon pyriformis]|nr:hypothetical protein G9A89_005663 [Geosiphon pyriformis]
MVENESLKGHRKILMSRSAKGFGSTNKSPPKILIKDPLIGVFFQNMARWASILYCTKELNYLGGEEPEIIGDVFLTGQDAGIVGVLRGKSTAVKFKNINNSSFSFWIVTFFIYGNFDLGPEMTRSKWKAMKFYQNEVTTQLEKKKIHFRIDSKWSKVISGAIFSRLLTKIEHQMEVIQSESINIFFTGHGIGGVYAQYLALMVHWELKKRPLLQIKHKSVYITVVTFGQPRAGNYEFAKLIDEALEEHFRVFRVTHTNDFVTQLPTMTVTRKEYLHSGEEFWITQVNCDCKSTIHGKNSDRFDLYQCPSYYTREGKLAENGV